MRNIVKLAKFYFILFCYSSKGIKVIGRAHAYLLLTLKIRRPDLVQFFRQSSHLVKCSVLLLLQHVDVIGKDSGPTSKACRERSDTFFVAYLISSSKEPHQSIGT